MESEKCEFCEKVIEGYRKTQVDHMMNQHVMAKHRDEFTDTWKERFEKQEVRQDAN